MKILIIDDDAAIVTSWVIVLKTQGFEIVTATEGKTGLDMAKTQKPAFILLDQILPDMRGNDVLTLLKEDPDTSDIPVAIVSNYSQSDLMQDAIRRGAVDYILKYQIEPQDLINKIKSLVEGPKNVESK